MGEFTLFESHPTLPEASVNINEPLPRVAGSLDVLIDVSDSQTKATELRALSRC